MHALASFGAGIGRRKIRGGRDDSVVLGGCFVNPQKNDRERWRSVRRRTPAVGIKRAKKDEPLAYT